MGCYTIELNLVVMLKLSNLELCSAPGLDSMCPRVLQKLAVSYKRANIFKKSTKTAGLSNMATFVPPDKILFAYFVRNIPVFVHYSYK